MSIKIEDLSTYAKNTWCPGCGNFGIERAAKQAFIELINEGKVKREKIVIVTGIGCHGKIADYINVNSFYSLHGRAIAPAIGMKLANPTLNIVVFAGDGDALGEGLEHTIFAAKRNVDITVIVHDNRVYALTTGQFTPTSPKGFRGGSTPKGSPEEPLNPIELMLVSGATFIARAYSANLNHTKELFKQAIMHKGFAFIDVLQPCYTFFDTYKYYGPRVYDLQQEGHNASDWEAALAKAKEWNYGGEEAKRIPIGLFFKADKTTYEDIVLSGKDLYDKTIPKINMVLQKHM
jgi:2-oxoglutarate ferredoxin oxidoreductase subunit beta